MRRLSLSRFRDLKFLPMKNIGYLWGLRLARDRDERGTLSRFLFLFPFLSLVSLTRLRRWNFPRGGFTTFRRLQKERDPFLSGEKRNVAWSDAPRWTTCTLQKDRDARTARRVDGLRDVLRVARMLPLTW